MHDIPKIIEHSLGMIEVTFLTSAAFYFICALVELTLHSQLSCHMIPQNSTVHDFA
jgi:hypothetical protein